MGLQNAAYNGKVTNQVGQREKELCVRARVDRIVVHLLVQCISNSQQQRFWISHDTDYRFSFVIKLESSRREAITEDRAHY